MTSKIVTITEIEPAQGQNGSVSRFKKQDIMCIMVPLI